MAQNRFMGGMEYEAMPMMSMAMGASDSSARGAPQAVASMAMAKDSGMGEMGGGTPVLHLMNTFFIFIIHF
jgi:hypothetical protein